MAGWMFVVIGKCWLVFAGFVSQGDCDAFRTLFEKHYSPTEVNVKITSCEPNYIRKSD
jgi:hypothetical protein